MQFESSRIKGKNRGKFLGFPTINLKIPKNFQLEDGIYAAFVKINDENFKGALHFGPVPTFNEPKKSLEVFLIDVRDKNIPELEEAVISVSIVKRLREVKKFTTNKDLILQMQADVTKAKNILNRYQST